MIRVGLARTLPSYRGLSAPYDPDTAFPELVSALNVQPGSTPNSVYSAVRGALRALGLDAERFGSPSWNPLGDLAESGATIVLKPNFIRHWNPNGEDGSIESVITHGSVLRAIADYAALAAGPEGRVVVAEAPQQDCDFGEIRRLVGMDELEEHFSQVLGRSLTVLDLRREQVRFRDGVIVERSPLPGDPSGYRAVDLGHRSFFNEAGMDAKRFRGADYDPGPTIEHHRNGRHAYLLSETVLSADLIVNLPKLKTHKKTGVTLALKNLVGINGDKNWLPHHSVGSPDQGGDEYPTRNWSNRLRSRAVEFARPLLARGIGTSTIRAARKLEGQMRGDDFVRSGNWYGNRTTWRMCCDLNRCVAYSDRDGLHLEARGPVRRTLSLIDGIVAGEAGGPLAPKDVPLGVVIAATDPIAADLTALRLMGFDERRIPKIEAPMSDMKGPRITEVRSSGDVEVHETSPDQTQTTCGPLDQLGTVHRFKPHPGWTGQIEASASTPTRTTAGSD
ncbi:MAG: DUF362 domain-containing protein [bacterium]|nr:DUF362 domain-containing protein [bacterium]